MWLFLSLVIMGFAGGILTGLLGIGSGIIYVFILPFALRHHEVTQDVMAQYTIANSFFGMVMASLSANITNYLHKDIYWRDSLWVSIPAALASMILLKTVVIKPWYSFQVFSLLLIGFLIFILISYHLKKGTLEIRSSFSRKMLSISGLISGSLSALTGLGGGGVLIPILAFKNRMDIKRAKSISLVMIFAISLSLTLLNLCAVPLKSYTPFQMGYVFFPVAIPMSLGVLLGSPAGVKLSHKLSSRAISIIFSIVLSIVIIEKLVQLI
jgi:uncharacterized membrane protein YfcA